jgi:hypothetical protein
MFIPDRMHGRGEKVMTDFVKKTQTCKLCKKSFQTIVRATGRKKEICEPCEQQRARTRARERYQAKRHK